MDDDPIKVYLGVVTTPALTRDEESELSQHVLDNDQQAESAGMRLIEANLAMVVSIAERYRNSGVNVLDLVIRGNNGLLVALNTFAGSSSESFSAHAATCVEVAIAKAIAKQPDGE